MSGGSRFYFVVSSVHCTRGATHVLISLNGGPSHKVRCGARLAYATGPVQPDTGYFARAVAVRIRRHRVVWRGQSVLTHLQMPAANDAWQPTGGVPGSPPRS